MSATRRGLTPNAQRSIPFHSIPFHSFPFLSFTNHSRMHNEAFHSIPSPFISIGEHGMDQLAHQKCQGNELHEKALIHSAHGRHHRDQPALWSVPPHRLAVRSIRESKQCPGLESRFVSVSSWRQREWIGPGLT